MCFCFDRQVSAVNHNRGILFIGKPNALENRFLKRFSPIRSFSAAPVGGKTKNAPKTTQSLIICGFCRNNSKNNARRVFLRADVAFLIRWLSEDFPVSFILNNRNGVGIGIAVVIAFNRNLNFDFVSIGDFIIIDVIVVFKALFNIF